MDYYEKAYGLLEDVFHNNKYLVGDHLTLADLACITTISSSLTIIPMCETKYPKLTAWVKLISELPYYKELNQKGADELNTLYSTVLEANRNKK